MSGERAGGRADALPTVINGEIRLSFNETLVAAERMMRAHCSIVRLARPSASSEPIAASLERKSICANATQTEAHYTIVRKSQ